jgi:hypothetical protein
MGNHKSKRVDEDVGADVGARVGEDMGIDVGAPLSIKSTASTDLDVCVTQPDGTELHIQASPNLAIVDFKQKIEMECGVVVDSFELFCKDTEVDNTDQLQNYLDGSDARTLSVYMVNGGEELINQNYLCHDLGFPSCHLDLLAEFYSKKECTQSNFKWLTPSGETWTSQRTFWDRKIAAFHEGMAEGVDRHVMWTHTFEAAAATDASEQRYLRVTPGEKIQCAMLYTHKETASTCIIQFQSTIDLHHPVADISQICHSSKIDKQAEFTLHAPQEPGLYMIWSKASYHYSFRQAEGTYPSDYSNAEDWYNTFIAWVRVDPNAQKKLAGKSASFQTHQKTN